MGLFFNYQRAGSGISKNAVKKSRSRLFFEIYTRKFWKLLELNLLFMLCCIPIITIGPATSAMMKVLKNYSIEKNSFLVSDFFESFKKDFLMSLPIGIINVICFLGCAISLYAYPQLAEAKGSNLYYVLLAITFAIGITFTIMSFYAYLMIPNINLRFLDVVKNSFIFFTMNFKTNLFVFFMLVLLVGGTLALSFLNLGFIFLTVCGLFSTCGFIVAFCCYPVIQKYIIEPYYKAQGKDNPEYDYLKAPEEETLFTDKGGVEAPSEVPASKSGKRGSGAAKKIKPKGKVIK